MSYQIVYHPDVKADLQAINRKMQQRIRRAIEQRLMTDPLRFGAPLRRSLKGYRKLRVGDYRIIFSLMQKKITILAIGHRKEIYVSNLKRRFSKR